MHAHIRNSPVHLPAICGELATLLAVEPEVLAAASSRNAAALFGWRN
jgi:TatD DNase family protein